jgi:ferric-dicitrate binding protein FerR (iron transport regulator)
MPTGDLQAPADVQPWTCPRCGRENKASWRTCPGCESNRVGELPVAAAPAGPTRRTGAFSLLLGLLVLAALVVLVVVVAPSAWQWVADQAGTFVGWIDERT